jgi:hypothetical protein
LAAVFAGVLVVLAVLVVRHAQHLVEAAAPLDRRQHALLAQRPPALFAELRPQLVRRRRLVDHAADLRRDLHHLVDAEAALEAAVVALLTAGALAERAVGLVGSSASRSSCSVG